MGSVKLKSWHPYEGKASLGAGAWAGEPSVDHFVPLSILSFPQIPATNWKAAAFYSSWGFVATEGFISHKARTSILQFGNMEGGKTWGQLLF